MINNQIHAPVSGKNSVVNGRPEDAGKQASHGKQQGQGGLFKLMMTAAQGGMGTGKNGAQNGANILGGNLTLSSEDKGGDKKSALDLLSEAGEEGSALSGLLKDGQQPAEGKAKNEETDAETATVTGDETGEQSAEATNTSGQTAAENSDAAATESTEGNTQTSGETSDGEKQVSAADSEKGGADIVSPSTEAQSDGASGAAASSDQTVISGEAVSQTGAGQGKASDAATVTAPASGTLNGDAASDKMKEGGLGAMLSSAGTINGSGNGPLNAGKNESIEGNVATDTRPEQAKSEGLLKDLQALAAAQGEQLAGTQKQDRLPLAQDGEAANPGTGTDEALVQEIFAALQNGSVDQVAAEIRSMKASQLRETRYSNYLSSFANRQDISGSGSALSGGSGSSTTSTGLGGTATMMPVQTMVPTGASVSSELFDENASVLWKEQITEYFESKDKSASENQAAAAFARLGDVPVTNISVRRGFAKGISQAIMSSTGNGKQGAEVWQKHNFVLEDGKNIQVAAREVDGVLQLKLSSSYTELNKLLMEHENEIRELLENELELKVDLQMDGGGDSDMAGLFGGSSQQQSKDGGGPLDLNSLKKTKEQQVEEVVPKAVRKFGYNQNEWTV